MKMVIPGRLLYSWLHAVLLVEAMYGQGVFFYSNASAPTRMGSLDGPLAGTNIYAQMFAGSRVDSLGPVGPVDFHINGIVSAGHVTVPGVPAYDLAYAQMLVWDSTVWGTILSSVPADQIGRTDIVPVLVTTGIFPDPTMLPRFAQPAIVPVPEPSIWMLGVLAGCLAFIRGFTHRQLRHGRHPLA